MSNTNSHNLPTITITGDETTDPAVAQTEIADRKYNRSKMPAVWIDNQSSFSASVMGNVSARTATVASNDGAMFEAAGQDIQIQIEVNNGTEVFAFDVSLTNHLVLSANAAGDIAFSTSSLMADEASFKPNIRVHNGTGAQQTVTLKDLGGNSLGSALYENGNSLGMSADCEGAGEATYQLCVGDPDPVITVKVPPCAR